MVQLNIPCPHEAGTAKKDETASDYHPLTKKGIGALLKMAKNYETLEDPAVPPSQVQVRLTQGIKGMTCPRPYTGKVARTMYAMDTLYVESYQRGNDPTLVAQFDKLLNG